MTDRKDINSPERERMDREEREYMDSKKICPNCNTFVKDEKKIDSEIKQR